jgi:hypothetical protein
MKNNQLKMQTIFGVLLIAWGILALLLSIINYLVLLSYGADNKLLFSLPIEILYGVLLIACGIGLSNSKSWARVLTLFVVVPLFIVIIPYGQLKYLTHFKYLTPKLSSAFLFVIIRITFGVSLLYFLTRPKIKEQFK